MSVKRQENFSEEKMKLRKTLKMLVPILALIMLIGACSKAEAKETEGTKDTTAETTTTETTEEEDKEEETEDVADPEDDDSAFVTFDYSEWVPDQNIEIDENYMKFYDYDAFYTSTDYPELKMVESADEITNEILKAEAQKLLDDGYTLTTAEENAKVLYGEGFFDDQNLAVAYLYNGIDAWKEGKSSYDSIDCYLASQEIIDIALGMNAIRNTIVESGLTGISGISSSETISEAIHRVINKLSNEVVGMNSMGEALRAIADKYFETESNILSNNGLDDDILASLIQSQDKRKWWQKIWDWIRGKKPDEENSTTSEQERDADEAMRGKLREILGKEEYSRSVWEKSSLEERKVILQNYMDEVIVLYGLQDTKTKPKIHWDKHAQYNMNGVLMGYYSDRSHKITLNEKVLTDELGFVESYLLLGTVAHELRHAYQHEAIRNPSKFEVSDETVKKWKDNFKHYISGNGGNFEKYYNQPVEVDARSFELIS